MTIEIKQSTAHTFLLGPFVDSTDGVAIETGLATAMDNATTGIRLSKNGGNMADRNDATAPVHDEDGWYTIVLDTTDTNTLGLLQVEYTEVATALPAWKDFSVVTANYWDTKYSTDQFDVNVTNMAANSIAVGVIATDAIGVLAMAAGSIQAGTIATGELTNIENEIWDALKSAHVVANSFGDFLDIEVSGRLASADINLTAGVLNEVTLATTTTTVTNDVGITATAVNLIWDEAMTETTGAPAVTASFREALKWMFALSRNVINQTATLTTLRNDADGADLATSIVSDNATTYVRGEWST